ncbi:hypothetical protein BJ875DRAFT_217998 [Amylocarpus encephaloides]|uniref:Heme oxygenase-like protein n=1 Tax=Amylocarpus encephaloides TaxID=45428 RepID=A0A9P7YMV9_9HELO|nr:hypothetical protein BJ875DRAFT_217998 [Amylocarpus encephaloides]
MPIAAAPAAPSDTLSQQINVKTRSLHTKLNKQILARLPLAIPPYSTTPSAYVSGLYHIEPIYHTFESLWQEIVDVQYQDENLWEKHMEAPRGAEDHRALSGHEDLLIKSTATNPRIHSLLSFLHIPSLLRARVLRDDIYSLTRTSPEVVDEQLRRISSQGNLAEFVSHMNKSIRDRPHVLLAYAWVLYMALFSGGRILRGVLQDASGSGTEFWGRELSPVKPEDILSQSVTSPLKRRSRLQMNTDGLGFFSFPGSQDGEDLKVDFKKRYAEIELRLTPEEKEEIVAEAQEIFKFMLGLITDLDVATGTSETDMQAAKLFHQKSKSKDSQAIAEHQNLPATYSKNSGVLKVLRKHVLAKLASCPIPGVEIITSPRLARNDHKMLLLWRAAIAVPALGIIVVLAVWFTGSMNIAGQESRNNHIVFGYHY